MAPFQTSNTSHIRIAGIFVTLIGLTAPQVVWSDEPVDRRRQEQEQELAFPALNSLRERWAEKGLTFGATYTGEIFASLRGVDREQNHYHGLLDVAIDADLTKLMGWHGLTFHANGYWHHGSSITADSVSTIAAISHIEATPTVRLFELWFEHKFAADRASLRFGQLAADAEFATLETSGAFISSTFGWNTLMTDNLPNGGPIYPLATPGVRLEFTPVDGTIIRIAAYSADPVGRCDGDPQVCNHHGFAMNVEYPPLLFSEFEQRYELASSLPGVIKFGGWHSFEDFEDQRFDAAGLALGDPQSSGIAKIHHGNSGAYVVIQQTLLKSDQVGIPEVILFARLAKSPEDRNEIDFYAEAGMTFAGLLPSRPSDVLGLAFSHTHISNHASASDTETFGTIGKRLQRTYEALLEISYTAEIMSGWSIQPDFQYYWRPGGGIAVDENTGRASLRDDVAVLGVRTKVKY